MAKMGHHSSMDPETSRSVGWLDGRPEVDKIVLCTFRPLKHRKPTGYVEIREQVGSGFRCTVYSGVGLRDIYVHTKSPALVRQLIEGHWTGKHGKLRGTPKGMEEVTQEMASDAVARQQTKVDKTPDLSQFSKVTMESETPTVTGPLETRGAQVSTGLDMRIIEFTPELALEYLEHNSNNRDLQEARVRDYAQDMLNGRWIAEASTIEIDTEGRVANGQHQLYAVVEAGMTDPNIRVRMRVTFGMPVQARQVIDTHRARNPWDVTVLMHPELRGQDFSKQHIAVLSWLAGRGWRRTGSRFRFHEIEPVLKAYGEAVSFALGLRARRTTRKGMTAAVFAVVARAWYTQDRVKLARFVEILYSGLVDDASENAAVKLREFFDKSDNSQLGQTELYQKTERALAGFLKGERIDRLYPVDRELFPIPDLPGADAPTETPA